MLNFDQSVDTSSTDFGTSGNLSVKSGPLPALVLASSSGGGSLEPLLGPEVSSRGGGSAGRICLLQKYLVMHLSQRVLRSLLDEFWMLEV